MMGVFLLGGFGIVIILMAFLIIPLAILSFVFWIWMLVDCIKNENISGNEKIAWVLVIALTHFLGAVIYFFAGRQRRRLQV
jgi:hypothetical protein